MADMLTSTASAPQEPPSEPTDSQAQAVSQPEPRQEQPVKETQTREQKPVNLQEIPEFKNWQRQTNQTIEQIRTQSQSRIQNLEQELERLATRDMSDEELTAREIQKRDQVIAEKEQAYQQLYQTYARDLAMAEIARKSGVEMSVFADADNPDEAWELALKARIAKEKADAEEKYKNTLASSPANSPDLGSRQAPSPSRVDGVWDSNAGLTETYRRLWDEYNA